MTQNVKPIADITQDFSRDFALLREDLATLTETVSVLLQQTAGATTGRMAGMIDNAKQALSSRTEDVKSRLSGTASDAQQKLSALSADVGAVIERHPVSTIVISVLAGAVIGMMSRPRR